MKFPSKSKYIYSSIELFVVYFFFFFLIKKIIFDRRFESINCINIMFGFDEVYLNLTR